MASIHFVRIPDREARKRAIKAFMEVRDNWVSFPGNLFGVSTDHVNALAKEQIPFELNPKPVSSDGKTPRPFNRDVMTPYAHPDIRPPLGVGALAWRYAILVPIEERPLRGEARMVADLDDVESLRAMFCDHFGGVTAQSPVIGYGLREPDQPESLELNRNLPFVVYARPIVLADRYFERLQAELQEALVQGLILVERQDAFLLGNYTPVTRLETRLPGRTDSANKGTSSAAIPPTTL